MELTAGDVLLSSEAEPFLVKACCKMGDGSLNLLTQTCQFVRVEGAGKLWRLRDEHVLLQIDAFFTKNFVFYWFLLSL